MTHRIPVPSAEERLLTPHECVLRLLAPTLSLVGVGATAALTRNFFALTLVLALVPICLGEVIAWAALWWQIRLGGLRIARLSVNPERKTIQPAEVFVRKTDAWVVTVWAAALQGWLTFAFRGEGIEGGIPGLLVFCALMADLGVAWQWHRYRKAQRALAVQEAVHAAEVSVALAGAINAHAGMTQALAGASLVPAPVLPTQPVLVQEEEKVQVGRAR